MTTLVEYGSPFFDKKTAKRFFNINKKKLNDKNGFETLLLNGRFFNVCNNGYIGSVFIYEGYDGKKYIGLPNKEQIANLIKKNLGEKEKGKALSLNDSEVEKIAEELIGFSNRSIVFLLDMAAKIARNDDRSPISAKHIKEAIDASSFEKVKEESFKSNKTKQAPRIGFA